MAETERKWAGDTFGTAWMHKKLIGMLRHTDVRVFYAFTALFVVPPCLIFGKSRRIIFHYLRHITGMGRWAALRKTVRNHWLFSQVVVDKFAMYAGKRFEVNVEGYDHYKHLEAQPEGFVQLSSHIGNYEIAGYTLRAERKRFNALVFGGEKGSVMEERNRMFSRDNIRLIPIADDMSHLFTVNSALADGECVSMPADRIFGSPRSIEVSLLGHKARLPLGPFLVPALRNLDVLAVNVMKTGTLRYTVYVQPLAYDKQVPTRVKAKQLAQAYVAELERMLRRYPEQWYNFFDFWE
jgi:predicted LPLAT superfamily acyltransferase